MSDMAYTLLWVVTWSVPSFLVQLLLCFKAKNKFLRNIPVYFSAACIILVVDMFFNFSGLHHGWHELGAFFAGCYVAVFTLGVALAFAVHRFYIWRKNRKR